MNNKMNEYLDTMKAIIKDLERIAYIIDDDLNVNEYVWELNNDEVVEAMDNEDYMLAAIELVKDYYMNH